VRGLNPPAKPFVCLQERPASLLDTATDPMLRTLSLPALAVLIAAATPLRAEDMPRPAPSNPPAAPAS
jgi:acid phosphatase (class A)